jgi:UrcA family protein
LKQRDSFAKSSADLRPPFMHGALPLFMLVPSPERLKRSRRKLKPIFGQSEDRILKAKFHSTTRSIGLALAAIACGIALTTPATADQSDGEPLTKVVSYADLNLNSEPGARTLYGRLRMAATQVCAPFRGDSLREKGNWRECFDSALARSVAEIDEPMLTAYHQSRTDKAEPPSRVAKDQ